MNYKLINNAILNGTDITKSVIKDDDFYNYLLGNNVAYYYARYLSKDRSVMDKKIITAGSSLNNKFLKTLKLINKVCQQNKINFLFFKTYKYFEEIVDGDIDMLVKEEDFYAFLKILQKKGFECFENEKLKAVCTKEGYCNIEPRVNAAVHGVRVLNNEVFWDRAVGVDIKGEKVLTTSREIDLLYLLLSILYRPDYLKMYLLLVYKSTDIKKIYNLIEDNKFKSDLTYIIDNLLKGDITEKRFPLFPSDVSFTIWWFKRILPNSQMVLTERFKNIIFFFYSKYQSIIFNKLVFRHRWPI